MIYAVFNSDTGVWQCSIKQGAEADGGHFDEVGDERWQKATAFYASILGNSSEWIEISQEDNEKYLLGSHGGDNDAGYIRDMQTGECISAPPIEKTYEEEVAEVQAAWKSQTDEIKDNYLDAVLTDDEGSADIIADCKERFHNVTAEGDVKIQELIDKYFNEKDGEGNG